MLLGLLLIGINAGTFDMVALATDNGRSLTTSVQVIAVLAIGIGLAVKTPMWPLHSWLPDAHTAAPTVGSVLLAGVLLKMGTYGFVRILLPIAPDGMRTFAPYLAAFAVVGIIYGSLACLALAQQGAKGDLKRLIAYSSVGHMGFVLLGISTMTPTGVNGALFANIAHGLITGLLFFLVGALKDRTGTTDLDTLAERDRRRALRQGTPPRRPARLRRRRLARPARPRRILGRDAGAVRRVPTPPTASAAPPSSPSWPSPRFGTLLTAAYMLVVVRRVCMGAVPQEAPKLADVQHVRVRGLDPARRPHRRRRPVAEGTPRPDRPGRAAAPRRRHPMSALAQPLAANLVQSVDWLADRAAHLAAVVGLVVLVADLFLPASPQAAARLAVGRGPGRLARSCCCPSWTATAPPSA